MSGLTKEQLEKFEKEGILVIENFLEQEEVTAIREEIFVSSSHKVFIIQE